MFDVKGDRDTGLPRATTMSVAGIETVVSALNYAANAFRGVAAARAAEPAVQDTNMDADSDATEIYDMKATTNA